MMNKKPMLKSVKQVYEVVQQVMQKSLKRARVSSEDILYQIFLSGSFEHPLLYDLFLKELESRRDQTTKKKD